MLTPKQAMFVKEYLKDLNGTQAAIRAGYSKKTANAIATENLAKPFIAGAVKVEMDKRAEKVDIDAEWVLREAKRTYEACHEADNLPAAVSALKLVGTHINIQAFSETRRLAGDSANPLFPAGFTINIAPTPNLLTDATSED